VWGKRGVVARGIYMYLLFENRCIQVCEAVIDFEEVVESERE
jgi:hypothetical protein